MSGFFEIAKMEIKADMQYKLSFMISLIIYPIVLLINVALFTSIYSFNGASQIKGYTLGQMIWYFTCTTMIWAIIYNHTDSHISQRVLSGELGTDLLRPMSLFSYELGIAVGERTNAVIVELLPSVVVYSLIYFPSFMTPISILKFICCSFLSFFMMFMLNYLSGLLAFVLNSINAVTSVKYIIINLLGGSLIPLDFFPSGVAHALRFLPFEYILYWPAQLLLNKQSAQGAGTFLQVIGIQLFWIAVLYAVCRLCWNRAVKHFCAVG